MEEAEGGPLVDEQDARAGLRSIFCRNSLCTFSYLLFELISFVALLSVSIGSSVLTSVMFEYMLEKKMSPFLQTYVTLYVLLNFGYIMARHHALYIAPIRHRFGNQAHFFVSCKYPCTISFLLLALSYINLFYQFTQLLCLPEVPERYLFRRHHKIPLPPPKPLERKNVEGTTALFLFSLCSIQYLTIRKLRWDYHYEMARMQNLPRFPTCGAYVYAVLLLTGVQLVLSVLYCAPILLWLLISRVFLWSMFTTLVTAALLSVSLGSMAAYIERQDPPPNVQHSQLHQMVNMRVRPYVLCLIYIPFTSYWLYYAEETACDSTKDMAEDGDLNLLNFFTINVCLCILSTSKFSALASRRRRQAHANDDDIDFFDFPENRIMPENVLLENRPPALPPPAIVENANDRPQPPASVRPTGLADNNNNENDAMRAFEDSKRTLTTVRSLSRLKYLWSLRSRAGTAGRFDNLRVSTTLAGGREVQDRDAMGTVVDTMDLNLNVLPVELLSAETMLAASLAAAASTVSTTNIRPLNNGSTSFSPMAVVVTDVRELLDTGINTVEPTSSNDSNGLYQTVALSGNIEANPVNGSETSAALVSATPFAAPTLPQLVPMDEHCLLDYSNANQVKQNVCFGAVSNVTTDHIEIAEVREQSDNVVPSRNETANALEVPGCDSPEETKPSVSCVSVEVVANARDPSCVPTAAIDQSNQRDSAEDDLR